MNRSPPLVILGGSSLVAFYLMQRLSAEGLSADVISRRKIDVPSPLRFLQLNLTEARNWVAPEGSIVISLVPLWILARTMSRFIGVQSIVALGSTSRFTKANSVDIKDRALAEGLEMAENIVRAYSLKGNIAYSVLRTTMIYDCLRDQNIARIARFIRRFHFFPLAAPGKGLRQPIHADDVAKAIINALGNNHIYDQILNIAGGEVLTYRDMVERIFIALKQKPRFATVPTKILQTGFRWASRFRLIQENAFGHTIFQRMNEDLIFDVSEGLEKLNYQPRKFEPTFS